MLRYGLVIALAATPLSGCYASDPLGTSKDTKEEVIAPLALTGRVVDAAEIIEASAEAELTQSLEALEVSSGVQLVVVTTESLHGQSIAEYSLALGNEWGIGDAERNDGLLLVVAPNERKVRIEVGLGLEDAVNDEEAASIITDAILPAFREGRFEEGIRNGVDRLILEVTPVEMKEAA